MASGTAGLGGTGVLASDSDRDNDSLSVSAVNGASGNVGTDVAGTYGTLHLNANGSYNYTANSAYDALHANQNVSDVFNFTVSDGTTVTQNQPSISREQPTDRSLPILGMVALLAAKITL